MKKSDIIVGILTGIFAGICTVILFDYSYLTTMVLLLLFMFIHLFMHELGHLIAGLCSGYHFVSFRIFSWILIRKDDKYQWKKLNMPFFAGQCLMEPTKSLEETHFILYNLGGVLMNVFLSIISLIFCFIFQDFKAILSAFALIGILIVLINGLPFLGLSNDGANLQQMLKSDIVRKATYNQLKINALQTQGMRIKDMDASLFFETTKVERQKELVSAIALFKACYMMDQGNIQEAYAEMKMLLEEDNAIADIHTINLKMECAFCEMMTNNDKQMIDNYLDKNTWKMLKAMKGQLSVLRFQYAYALLVENDKPKATKILEDFKKYEASSPFEGEIIAERDWITMIDEKYQAKCVSVQ